MGKRTTWILIADGARARVLANDGPGTGLTPVFAEEFVSPAGRARIQDMVSDQRGRTFDSVGRGQEGIAGGRHGMEPPSDPKRHAQQGFARELIQLLEEHARQGAFARLVLAAAPRTLGDLRAGLTPALRERVVAEIDKDLTGIPDRDLAPHFEDMLKL
jgi:protein required for attachment to host cells